MTKDEALDRYAALSDEVKATFNEYRSAYQKLRLDSGPDLYITREMLAEAHGSNSIDMASKFQGTIEGLEGDQPRRRRGKKAKDSEAAPQQHPAVVQAALDGVRAAVEAVSKTVTEARSSADAELSAHFQVIIRDQQVAFEVERQEDEIRIRDLEQAAAASGDECWNLRQAAKQLSDRLEQAEAERDRERAGAQDAIQLHQIERAKLAAAEAQIEAGQVRTSFQAAEIARLQDERQGLVAAAASANEVQAENAILRERATTLADQVGRLEKLIAEMDERHAREREAMRAAHETIVAEERGRTADLAARLGSFGAPIAGDNQEERS